MLCIKNVMYEMLCIKVLRTNFEIINFVTYKLFMY